MCNLSGVQWAASGRFSLYLIAEDDVPLLTSKWPLVKCDFHRCDMLESAENAMSARGKQ